MTSRLHAKRFRSKKTIEHNLGFMQWNSITQNFEYTNLGRINSLSALSTAIINDF